jgi:DtxR family Mn-dependent transcriptional regulator
MEKLASLYADTGLTSNMEDYMEAIAMLSEANKVVRVKDIAKQLSIKMPSVSAALDKLKDLGLIEYEKYGFIELTEEGEKVAQQVCMRHSCLSEFFEKVLRMDRDEADQEACKVEHDIMPSTCARIKKFLDFYLSEEKSGSPWIEKLSRALK